MRDRTPLQEFLDNLVEDLLKDGLEHVYYQPPETLKINYPAIIYKLSDMDNTHANNGVYQTDLKYLLTVVDSNPDSAIRDAIIGLPKVAFDRSFVSNNRNHYVFVMQY